MALLELDFRPPPRALRQFAAAFLVFFGGLAFLLRFGHGVSLPLTAGLWGLAVAVGILGLRWPNLVQPVYAGMMAVTAPIGMLVSFVVLAVTYFLVVTPLGLARRALKGDTLKRGFDRDARTYWVKRETGKDVKRYFRQY
jgi:hypothetical protein